MVSPASTVVSPSGVNEVESSNMLLLQTACVFTWLLTEEEEPEKMEEPSTGKGASIYYVITRDGERGEADKVRAVA